MLKIIDNTIYIVRGDDETLTVNLNADGEPAALGENDVLTLTVRELPSETSPIILSSTSPPGSNVIAIRHEDTAEKEYGQYSADIQLTTAAGLRRTVWPVVDEDNIPKARASNLKNFVILPEVTMT